MKHRSVGYAQIAAILSVASFGSSHVSAADKRLVVCQGDRISCVRNYDIHVQCPDRDASVDQVGEIYCWDNGGYRINKLSELSDSGHCGTTLYEVICNEIRE